MVAVPVLFDPLQENAHDLQRYPFFELRFG